MKENNLINWSKHRPIWYRIPRHRHFGLHFAAEKVTFRGLTAVVKNTMSRSVWWFIINSSSSSSSSSWNTLISISFIIPLHPSPHFQDFHFEEISTTFQPWSRTSSWSRTTSRRRSFRPENRRVCRKANVEINGEVRYFYTQVSKIELGFNFPLFFNILQKTSLISHQNGKRNIIDLKTYLFW